MITGEALGDGGRVTHAFFTREGGVSEGIYASLNCGLGSGDHPDAVRTNRARAAVRLGLSEGAVVTAYQVHSATIAVVDSHWRDEERPKVDGLVTKVPGIALGILTADCAPVLLADPESGVVGAAHAGWRGALAGVVEATVGAMMALGAKPARMAAAVGPCIRQRSYEVGPDVRDAVCAANGGAARLFVPSDRRDRFLFDLPGYVTGRLEGVAVGAIEALPLDTYADATRFFSYRRTTHAGGRDYGRMLSAIALQP
ncbi:MAG: peptidoglycan editing factor PgeF [Rhodospirillales bacterium]|nr:MAG: peptidoglycan editing factor PgeF [Rhodospirillales bacterium]